MVRYRFLISLSILILSFAFARAALAQASIDEPVYKVFGDQARPLVDRLRATANKLRQTGTITAFQKSAEEVAHYFNLQAAETSPLSTPEEKENIDKMLAAELDSFKQAASNIIEITTTVIQSSENEVDQVLKRSSDLTGTLNEPQAAIAFTGAEAAQMGRFGFAPRSGWDVLFYRTPWPRPSTTRGDILDALGRSKKWIQTQDARTILKKTISVVEVIGGSIQVAVDVFAAPETAGATILSLARGFGGILHGAKDLV